MPRSATANKRRHTSPGRPAGERAISGDADALIAAGEAAERAGQRNEARGSFERALYTLSGPNSAARAAALLRWIARTYMIDGDGAAAADCVDAALAVSRASGDAAGEGHAINVQAAVRWAQGDLDTAESLYLEARACAIAVGERVLVAMTSVNLGAISAVRGELADALSHFQLGLQNYRVLERSRDVCIALNNIGKLYTDLERWPAAEAAYAEGIDIANAIGDRNSRIALEVNVADMWIARGDAKRAELAVENAARLGTETGDESAMAQLDKLRGVVRRDAGDWLEAERHFSRAAERAEARQDLVLLAETLRERASLFRGQGRNREALQNLNRSHRLFTQLRAKRELANVDRSVARLEDDFVDLVERWGESIEAKDRYTQGHCVRVADMACAIALATGIDGQSLFWFRIGALLHDVGKLVVPPEILNKPGKLTDEEWALMRSHPSAGVDMIAGVDFPWDVRPIIESHHERWDGKGYPHGLSGEGIPIHARILALADVYDALTTVRSYKEAMTHEAAMRIMRRERGGSFDPAVFDHFDRVVDDVAFRESAARLAKRGDRQRRPPASN